MRMISCFILSVLFMSEFGGATEPIAIGLNQGDSISLFDQFCSPPQSQWKTVMAPTGPIQVLTLIKTFNTQDNFVQVTCTADNIQGAMMGHQCNITINEMQGSAGSNEVRHYTDQVIAAVINTATDSQNLYDQILKPLPLYSSVETASIKAPSGDFVEYPRLQISCNIDYPYTPPRSCEIIVVK